MPVQPNVILIMADQWRGDCLSVAGHPVVHTPYLDTLARRGTLFTHAYSAAPTCIPSRAGLYTGLRPSTHGRVGYLDGVPWNYPTTLAGEFTRHGYQTQAIGKLHVYPERSQVGFQNVILHDGFINFPRSRHHNYDEIDDYLPWLRQRYRAEADYFDHGLHCNSYAARPWDKPEDLHPTNFVARQGVAFLRRRDPRKPFFLYLSFHRPHPPYDPPAWAFEQYLNTAMPPPPVGDWVDLLDPYVEPWTHDTPVAALPPHLLQRARAGYYGHMTHIDQQINRFLWALKEYDLLDNSVVCFTADHGEMLGDHHMFRKAYPYEGSARVPLILAGPRGVDSAAADWRQGAMCDPVVELRDIMPTLLESAGLPVPDAVEGRSLLPWARGESPAWRATLHGEHVVFGQSMQWLTDGKKKYIWWSGAGHEQLFDLQADPDELHDLARRPEYAAELGAWRARLAEELSGREEGFVQDGRLVAGRPVHPCLSFLRAEAGLEAEARAGWHNRGAIA